ncbi:hypothetical protein ACS0TY_030195 [Phlomoides rotata]
MTLNVRGLGKKIKRSEIKQMTFRNGIDVCCLQESKLEKLDERTGKELWFDRDFDWAWREAEGRSGGIITIWNRKVFCKISSWHIKGMLAVNGFWVEDGMKVMIINVYAPCKLSAKAQLWDAILIVLEQNQDIRICVVGDFNSIREESERIGRSSTASRNTIAGEEIHMWNRNLNKRERLAVDSLTQILTSYNLEQRVGDLWKWSGANNGIYSTKVEYNRLMEVAHSTDQMVSRRAFKLLWNSLATRREQAIGWKILHQKMPTKAELRKRGIIPEQNEITCSICGKEEEMEPHLFFTCSFAYSIWLGIYNWCGIQTAQAIDPMVHLEQHSNLLGSSKSEPLAAAIWTATVGAIWKSRNTQVFDGVDPNLQKALDEIKAKTWPWFSTKTKYGNNQSFSTWHRNLRLCIE